MRKRLNTPEFIMYGEYTDARPREANCHSHQLCLSVFLLIFVEIQFYHFVMPKKTSSWTGVVSWKCCFFCVVHHTATKMNFETCNQRSFRAFSLGRTSLLMWFCFLFADFVFAFWFKMRRRVFLRHEFRCWSTRPLLRLWTVGLLQSRFLVAHARAHLDFGVDFLTYNA